ncbi:hypothetical protein [Spirillospora sp. NPDC048824]|uniref:hypothetical protein n=1 Tax=Spirillospora sp. NPDC048824 TaxID=3364526 RepID=UPI0037244D41
MGVEDNTKADARAETTGEPTSHERPYTPPPDNPGSPGQPSRRESLARAREAQQARAAQRIEAGDTGGEPSGEHDTTPTAQGPENGGEKPQADDQRTDEPGDNDQPTTQAAEGPADPRTLGTDQAKARDHEALPRRPGTEPPDISDDHTDGPQPATDTGTSADDPGDASDDWERRISGEGLLPDDDARVADLDEDAVERSVADRLRQVVGKLDRSDQPKELAETVDRPDFQDPTEDPQYVPDRYGTPLERRDGTRTPLFDGEPTREQTEQGALGDCGIIATLGAVAEHHPEAIRDCVREGRRRQLSGPSARGEVLNIEPALRADGTAYHADRHTRSAGLRSTTR